MDDLTSLSVGEFLDRVTARTPTPGGGSVTGLAGALGCALGGMVAAYSLRKDTEAESRQVIDKSAVQLHRCEGILRALITQDAAAYQKMSAAGRARRESPGDAAAAGEYERAVFDASAVPMEMAAVASNALVAIDAYKHLANPLLLSDLAIAASLVNIAARAARSTLQVNAQEIGDESQRESLLADIDRIILHAARNLASIEAFVEGHT
jgi:glutamate formiminotransferase/formiminotetrahydrofolate cyclodeaminase